METEFEDIDAPKDPKDSDPDDPKESEDNDGEFKATPEARGDIVEEPEASEEEPKAAELDLEQLAEVMNDPATRITIPKARFDENNAAKKAAEARVLELQAENEALKAAASAKGGESAKAQEAQDANVEALDKLEEEILAATVDGDMELAKKLQKEARALNNKINAALVEERAAAIASKTLAEARRHESAEREQADILAFAGEIIKENPFLGEGGDAAAIKTFGLLRDDYIKTGGKTTKEAMAAALTDVQRFYGQLAAKPKPASGGIAQKEELAGKQPPRPSAAGVGQRSSEAIKKVKDMSEEEFAAMPAAEKARQRGDDYKI